MSGAGFYGELKLIIVEVDSDGRGAGKMGSCDDAVAHAAAAEDGDFVGGSYAASGNGVKTYRERLHEAELFDRKRGRVEFFRGHGDVFCQRTIALDMVYDRRTFDDAAGAGAASLVARNRMRRMPWR